MGRLVGPEIVFSRTLNFSSAEKLPKELFLLGNVVSAVGLSGVVRLACSKPFFDLTRSSKWEEKPLIGREIWISNKNRFFLSFVEKVSLNAGRLRLRIAGIDSRSAAEEIVSFQALISRSLIADERILLMNDLIGYAVRNLQGKFLGQVVKIDGNNHQNWICTEKTLIPYNKVFISEIIKEEQKLIVDWKEGW